MACSRSALLCAAIICGAAGQLVIPQIEGETPALRPGEAGVPATGESLFGAALAALSNTVLAVGSPLADGGGVERGEVTLFTLNSIGAVSSATLLDTSELGLVDGGGFGCESLQSGTMLPLCGGPLSRFPWLPSAHHLPTHGGTAFES